MKSWIYLLLFCILHGLQRPGSFGYRVLRPMLPELRERPDNECPALLLSQIRCPKIFCFDDVPRRFHCLQYGQDMFSGVYVVSRCNSKWNGSAEIKQKCEGSTDFSDPINASPATNPIKMITYKNLYCAECNHAKKKSLMFFHHIVDCKGLHDLNFPREEMVNNLSYDPTSNQWGVNWTKKQQNSIFVECKIYFDVPSYLEGSVRRCTANLVSTCGRKWNRDEAVRKLCQEYTSVVYDETRAYKNPHCAICNNRRKMSELSCSEVPIVRYFSFSDLIDINWPGNQCRKHQLYDPYRKKCRKLNCVLPGYVIRFKKCVKAG